MHMKAYPRRQFVKGLGLGAAALIGRGMSGLAQPSKRMPNVVFILADDLGWRDTSLYGSTFLETPNVERLAKRGMMFTQAYAANPLCSPTRASIATGLWPARIGITSPACHLKEEKLEATVRERGSPSQKALICESATRLKLEYYTLAEALKDAGYRTGHFGKWHLGHEPYDPLHQGFDVDVPHWPGPGPAGSYVAPWKFSPELNFTGEPGEHIEDRMANEAVRFIRESKDGPFYLNYWCFSVHAPHDAKQALVEEYAAKADPDNPQRHPVYGAMVHSLDDAVGRLLDTLDELDLADNTIIVFFSDNGGIHWPSRQCYPDLPVTSNAPLRGGKATMYEGGTREPLVVVWPGVVKRDSKSDEIVQSIDFHPTILEMLGLEPKAGQEFDGISIVPALKGRPLDREAIFCYFPHQPAVPDATPPSVYVRKGDWKLIRFFFDGDNFAHRYELYNLKQDIGETTNLADRRPEKVRELDALIEQFLADSQPVLPKPNPAYNPGVAGWEPSPDASLSVSEGILVMESTGGDPFMSNREVPTATGDVVAEMRVRSTASGPGQVFFAVADARPLFHRDRSVPLRLTHDGEWHEASVTLPLTGSLTAFRIDPANAPGRIEFDWIRLKSADEAVLKEWAFDNEEG
jgi:arylsulfatase A-like enzyme